MNKTAGLILAPLSAIYSVATRVRRALYTRGVLRAQKINAPVISIGNITTGGTGKTPLVAWVARVAAQEGRRVCILTRGYGRADANRRVLVSDGERILADAREGGDEPFLLAEMLQGVAAVVSDADRVAAARYALENLESEVFILDDGFQHLRLARDLDLVTVDATNPWGGGNLLPRGHLREPLNGLARADCIIVTRSEQAQDIDALRKQASRLSGGRPILLSRTRTRAIRVLSEAMPKNDAETRRRGDAAKRKQGLITNSFSPRVSASPRLRVSSFSPHPLPSPIAAFCAIGNPSAFFAQIRHDSNDLKFTRAFPDHHVYVQSDVDALVSEAMQAGALGLLTTAKDAVKLRSLHFELPCYVLEIELEFDDEEKLVRMIREAIQMTV
ncbi:MAG: tetraacyldisaccharide 4-kinase [Acidobacteriota bacterium]|jgi:tetraacyldisaccharide 4'-kinase|nr:tetraacyldisaccharide 4-kinase [Acidobacteriota bacterium]